MHQVRTPTSPHKYGSPFKTAPPTPSHPQRQRQYQSVILEITPRFIKAGFLGDASPLTVIKWKEAGLVPRQRPNLDQELTNTRSIDHLMLSSSRDQTHVITLVNKIFQADLFAHKWLYNTDSLLNDDEIISSMIRDQLHDIFYNTLLVRTRQLRIFIPEPILNSNYLKKILANVLFQHFQVQSLVFVPNPLMSCVGAGIKTGLVISLDWDEVTVVPVYDLRVLSHAIGVTERSAKWLHYQILKDFAENMGTEEFERVFGDQNTSDTGLYEGTFDVIDRFISKSCFLSPVNDFPTVDNSDFTVNISKEVNFKIRNRVRHLYVDQLCESAAPDEDDDNEMAVIDLVLNKVFPKLTLDSRTEILQNVIITGNSGLDRIAGLKSKIILRLREKMPKFQFLLCKGLDPWAGTSLYCSVGLDGDLKASGLKEFKRDKYLNAEQ